MPPVSALDAPTLWERSGGNIPQAACMLGAGNCHVNRTCKLRVSHTACNSCSSLVRMRTLGNSSGAPKCMLTDADCDAAGDVSFSAAPVPNASPGGHPAVYAIAQPIPTHRGDILVRNNAGVYKCVLRRVFQPMYTVAYDPHHGAEPGCAFSHH